MVAKKSVKKTIKKAPTHKRTTAKKTSEMKSFRLYKDTEEFTTFRVTRQTVYWSILLLVVIITQLWILKIQMEIAELTNTLLMQ